MKPYATIGANSSEPCMMYGSELWVCSDAEKEYLDSVQRVIARKIQGLRYDTSNAMVNASLGWVTLSSKMRERKVKFIVDLLRLDADNIYRRLAVWRIQDYVQDMRDFLAAICGVLLLAESGQVSLIIIKL